MISLTDAQMTAISNVARPLQPTERAAFMAALFEELLGRRDGYAIGDGELARALRDLQRKHFRYPTDADCGWGARLKV
jgi:hypothetical protein